MSLLLNKKAVSTFILIILMLCSIIFGALISYLWVMSSYYNMPEDTTLLIVTDAVFPINDATYFNVTILNPSNSIADVNITAIRLSIEEDNASYNVTTIDSVTLPFLISRGTKQTLKCLKNWSEFTGKTVRIEPLAANVSTKSYSYTIPMVKLKLSPNFDVTRSIEYFNLTIENSAQSIINLTISEVMVFGSPVNTTPTLPKLLSPNQTETFKCEQNWEDLKGTNVTIKVKTEEGYEWVYTTGELLGAVLYIDKIDFDYTDTSYFNLTISSSQYSTANAILQKVNLTLQDNTTLTVGTSPPLGIIDVPVQPNQSMTIKCLWDWSTYRNETFTVSVYTKQGFTVPNMTQRTPPDVVWNITDVKFDLDHVDYFLVNVTNTPCSLNEINVTGILLDGNTTIMDPAFAVLTNGTEAMFNCSLSWSSLVGKNATITVQLKDGSNVSRIVAIAAVQLKLLDKPAISEIQVQEDNVTILTIPYVNITVSNSIGSIQNVTITKIVFETENATYQIDGALTYPELVPDGYTLKIGENITILCLWNWGVHLGFSLKVTVYTAEGFQISETWYAPFAP